MARGASAKAVRKPSKRKRRGDDIKYSFVFARRSKWTVGPRVGFARVLGMYDTAKNAAKKAAEVWNVELSSLVRSGPVADRVWTRTQYRWIWQRGVSYVLRRREKNADFSQSSTNLDELVEFGMLRWGLTRADMTRWRVQGKRAGRDTEGAAVEPPNEIPGMSDEEELPATQPYPEDVLIAPEGTPKAGQQADEEQDDSDNESRPSSTTNWGAAKFVAATLANDPNMLPGDIADLEGRAAGHIS